MVNGFMRNKFRRRQHGLVYGPSLAFVQPQAGLCGRRRCGRIQTYVAGMDEALSRRPCLRMYGEVDMRKIRSMIVAVLTLAASGMLAVSLRECIAIDHCLDQGGRWDDEDNACQW